MQFSSGAALQYISSGVYRRVYIVGGYIVESISSDPCVCWLGENDKMVLGRFPNKYAGQHTQAAMFYDYV